MTADQVRSIVALNAQGVMQSDIARALKTHPPVVSIVLATARALDHSPLPYSPNQLRAMREASSTSA